MNHKNVHTVQRHGTWANVREGAKRASSVHETKSDAVERGREIARASQAEHIIHTKDGVIASRNTYGRDPYPPRG
jgi:uncharacterized protein YdaT